MSVQVLQTAKYQGNNFWKWSVWIDAPMKELKEVESVTYILDPSFPKPIQVVKNRARKFRLDASGHAEFRIDIAIRRKNGRVTKKMHWLELKPAGGQKEPDDNQNRPVIYLISAAADIAVAAALRESLEKRHIKVITSTDAQADIPLQELIRPLIDEANIAIAIVSDSTSRWVTRELQFVREQRLPYIPVVVGDRAKIPEMLREWLSGWVSFAMRDAGDADAVAQKLAEQIGRPNTWQTR